MFFNFIAWKEVSYIKLALGVNQQWFTTTQGTPIFDDTCIVTFYSNKTSVCF